MSNASINAETREAGINIKKLHQEGFAPGVIYLGDKKTSLLFKIDSKVIAKLIQNPSFMTQVLDIVVGDKKLQVIAKEIAFHPVTDAVSHIDFMEVNPGDKIKVRIPIRIINKDKSPGIKRGGDVFMLAYSVVVNSVVGKIPEYLTVDISGSNIGDRFSLSNITLPEETTMIKDHPLAKISGRSGGKQQKNEDQTAAAS